MKPTLRLQTMCDASMNDIFCLGDGFAHGHIWPEWPQILAAILPQYRVHTITGVGAGNEFLINGLLQQDVYNQTVIFQWASYRRFDKIVEEEQWHTIGKQDPVYHFNFYSRKGDIWWLSSASVDPNIKLYHDFYVQEKQAWNRFVDQKKLLTGYLMSLHCHYVETSTEQQVKYSVQPRFSQIRGQQRQPSPLVHYYFLMEEIIPKLSINIDHCRADRLHKIIEKVAWRPFDPDRDQIWKDIVNSLDND